MMSMTLLAAAFLPYVAGNVGGEAQFAAALRLGPEVLVVSGIDATGASGMLDRLAGFDRESVRSAELNVASLMLQRAELVDAMRANPGDAGVRGELATVEEALASARSAVATARNNALNAATAAFDGSLRTIVSRARQNASKRIPAEFWAAEGKVADHLASCLIEERRSARTGQPISSGTSSTLAAARSSIEVAQARTWLGSRLAAVRLAFEAR